MQGTRSIFRFPTFVALAAAALLAACSEDGADSLAGPEDASPASDVADVSAADLAAAGEAEGGSNRIEARLNPVISVDASGQARLENEAGTANDRFDAQVEIAKQDFGRLDIDAGDGFQDEVVVLRVFRGGSLITSNRLRFSENRPQDITFEFDIRGAAAPELRVGDVGRVIVNGNSTLRGTFQRD